MNYSVVILGLVFFAIGVYLYFFYSKMTNLPMVSDSEKIITLTDKNIQQHLQKGITLVDFWAAWCGPCKMVAPVLEELQKEYGNNLVIYKVNTENERELSALFGIQSIPSLLFVPINGQPQMAMGALPKATFEKAIADEFLSDSCKKDLMKKL